ncbi:MAG: hypothetical protein GX974_05355 [Clostridiales bacterium]|nr:hypothetical protein [Clostridiales bacterium]
MVLRLIPSFKSQIMAISGARKSIGKANGKDSKRQRLFSSMDVLSALTSWALEGAIITADSMKSRGYGSGKRTHFSNYRFCIRDGIVFSIMLIGLSMVILGAIGGGMQISYYPTVSLSRGTWHMVVGALGYMMFLFIPSAIHIGEDIIWHILRSRI